MLKPIEGLPDNVVGLSAAGKITGEDYETVLLPLLKEKLESHDKIAFLFQLGPDYEGYKAAAAWDDAKVGLKHFADFERIAIVTNDKKIIRTIKTFGFMMPGEVRLFSNAELEEAKAWISG